MRGVNRQEFEARRHSKFRKRFRRCVDCGERVDAGLCTFQRELLCVECDRAREEEARLWHDLARLNLLPSIRGC
jgi:hypothetical protein